MRLENIIKKTKNTFARVLISAGLIFGGGCASTNSGYGYSDRNFMAIPGGTIWEASIQQHGQPWQLFRQLSMIRNVLGGHYSQVGLMSHHAQQYGHYRDLINRYRPPLNRAVIMPNYHQMMNYHLQQFNRYYNQTRMTP